MCRSGVLGGAHSCGGCICGLLPGDSGLTFVLRLLRSDRSGLGLACEFLSSGGVLFSLLLACECLIACLGILPGLLLGCCDFLVMQSLGGACGGFLLGFGLCCLVGGSALILSGKLGGGAIAVGDGLLLGCGGIGNLLARCGLFFSLGLDCGVLAGLLGFVGGGFVGLGFGGFGG